MSAADSDAGPSGPPATRRRRRRAISRHDVLAAALELIDQEGLDALSIRRLAERLDMEPMSLYKRVADKDDLLAGIAELVWNQVAAAAPTDDWADWLRTLGAAIRAAVGDHPNTLPVLVQSPVFPTSMLDVIATQLERETPGWPARADAVAAVCNVTAFALGCAVAESSYCTQTTSDDPATAERQRLRRIARALPADTPDRLIDTAVDVCSYDTTTVFTRGLDLIFHGCQPNTARQEPTPPQETHPPSRREQPLVRRWTLGLAPSGACRGWQGWSCPEQLGEACGMGGAEPDLHLPCTCLVEGAGVVGEARARVSRLRG